MPRYVFPALIDEVTDAGTNAAANTASGTSADRLVSNGRTAEAQDDDEQFITALEKNFPHILEKIQALWGYPEMNYYFLRLTIDERGDRQGFPTEVWDDLQILVRIHHDLYPS